MICASCGTENERGRKFCLECGTKLASGCPNCGAANPPGAKFCGECGTTLTADAVRADASASAAQPAATPVAERRVVSVLFADLVGFTTLAEGRDPEETRELLSRYFELARDVIGRYGGTVEKFIGDAVMAVWGAPTAHEDDAERAVRAGLDLVDAVRALGPGIEARAGVLTGEAAVTIGATGEGMVAGDIVNTASRLQSVAPSGAVLVGEATQRAAGKAIVFEEAGPQLLKGKAAPVPAWRAARVVAQVGGRNRSENLEAPFVGRDEEFRLIKDLFHSTGRDSRLRVASVLGPAGIGKSRLAWEFLKYVDGLTETVYWHDGRSPAYGDGITFWALGEMVRERCGLLETADEATTRERVHETVGRWIRDEAERTRVEPALLSLLGIATESAAAGDELFVAWRLFFEGIAAEATVVMVFEDLHWADQGLLDFIDHLLEWSRGLPIYVVTLARPELLERRPDWGAAKRNFTSVTLEPLTQAAMRELLTGLVPGLPEPAIRAIVGRADGIPLYAVEIVRMLLAEGRLVEVDGAYRPADELGDVPVPETLQALISARLDALDPVDRSILQDAAVLGHKFGGDGLAAISGLDLATLEPHLRTLVRRELLVIEADPRSPERGQYGFVQALIREVAYNTLARPERKSRHLAAARWFEALDEGELAGALAAQYLAAYRSAPEGPEADALASQARLALKGASDRAMALGSNRQALAFDRQALEIATDEDDRIAILEHGAAAAFAASDFDAAEDLLEPAIEAHRARGDLVGVARATTVLGTVFEGRSQPGLAARALEAAVAETSELGEHAEVVGLLTELSRAYGIIRDPRALATADRALEIGERLGLTAYVAEALLNRALALGFGGRLEEPIALLRGVRVLAEREGLSASTRMRATNNLAAMLEGTYPREALIVSDEGIAYGRSVGHGPWTLFLMIGRLDLLRQLGEWDESARAAAELESLDLPSSFRVNLADRLAIVRASRGDIGGAEAALLAVQPLRAEIDDPRVEGWLHSARAYIALMAARYDEAYAEGMESARAGEDGSEIGAELAGMAALWLGDARRAAAALDVHRVQRASGPLIEAARAALQAGIDGLEGRRSAAVAGYRAVIATFRAKDLPVNLGLALMDLATIGRPDPAEARAAADEARAIFTRIGSPPLLSRLDAALAAAVTESASSERQAAIEAVEPALG